MGEKRRLKRVNWFVEAKIHCVEMDLFWNVRLTDISEGGCFVDTIVPLDAGTKITLMVKDDAHTLDVPGRILYVNPGFGSAIEFDPLEPDLRSKILAIMQSRSDGAT